MVPLSNVLALQKITNCVGELLDCHLNTIVFTIIFIHGKLLPIVIIQVRFSVPNDTHCLLQIGQLKCYNLTTIIELKKGVGITIKNKETSGKLAI